MLPLRGEPAGIVVAKDEKRVYVSLAQLDEVVVVESPNSVHAIAWEELAPRAHSDGKTLLAANFQGGDISLVDTER